MSASVKSEQLVNNMVGEHTELDTAEQLTCPTTLHKVASTSLPALSSSPSPSPTFSAEHTNSISRLRNADSFAGLTPVSCLSPVSSISLPTLIGPISVRIYSLPLPTLLTLLPGNARLQGLPEDTLNGDPTGKLFDWVNSAFFFSYIIVQIPATITSKLFSPRLWLGSVAMGPSLHTFPYTTHIPFRLGRVLHPYGRLIQYGRSYRLPGRPRCL